MAVGVTHIVDQRTPEDGVRLLSLLLRRLPEREVRQRVVVIGHAPPWLHLPEGVARAQVGRRFDWPMASALDMQRKLRRDPPDVVLAWNADAAAVVRAVWRGRAPLAVTVCDPAEAARSSRWWRSAGGAAGGMEILCTSALIQRRLIEAGVAMSATAVIRPGVDYAELRIARERMDRRRLGLPATGRMLLTPSPPSRIGGQFYAVWAAAVLHHTWPDAGLLVPGTSREQQRLVRLIESIYCPQIYCVTEDRFSPAELLSVSDALIVPALGDVPTGWLAWAMAAGVPIIGSAVPSVAELIADRENGFLCRAGEPHTLAIRIRTAFEAGEKVRQCVETARGQAYEVFRSEQCVDAYRQVIRNLAGGEPAVAHLWDTAVDA